MSNGNRIESMDQNDNNVCLSSSLPSSSSSLSGQQQTNNSSNNNNNGGIHQMRYSFQKQPFVIGVAGGTASGKSTVCSKIIKRLGPIDPTSIYLSHEKRVVRISQDSFYRKLTDDDRQMVDKGLFNFDHPTAFDVDLMVKTLRDVCDGKMVRVPIYNYNENEISDKEEIIYPADVILFEGLLLFYFPELRNMFHMKIFVDTDPDTRLSRRVMRDVKERNRDLSSVLAQYLKFVKPSFEEFCLPTKKYADIVVPRGPDNEVAVDLIVTQIHSVVDPSIRHRTIKFGRLLFFNNNNNNNEDCEFKQEKIINVQKSNKKQSSSSSLSLPSSKSTLSTTIEKQTTVNGHVVNNNGFNNEKDKSVNGFLNNVIDSIPKSIPIHIKYPNNGVNGVNGHHNHHASLLADEFDDMYLSSSAPSFMTHGILKFNKPSLMINNEINNENDMDFPNQRRQSSYSSSPLSTSSSSSSTTSVSPITTTATTTTITKSIDNNGQTAKILMIASR